MFKRTMIFNTTALAGLLLTLGACNDAAETPAANTPTPAAEAAAAASAATGCDRQCLIDATDAYVAALVAHNPAQAPLADNLVFVENATKMQPGAGLWQSAVMAPSSFIIHVPDVTNHAVGYLAMMTAMQPALAPQGASPEDRAAFAAANPPTEQPVIVALRLQFDDAGEVTEAEHLLAAIREPQMVNLQTPRPGILTEIPVAARKSHDELIAMGLSYYDALDDNNGELMPFAADCERHENGMITASGVPAPAGAAVVPGAAPAPARARDCRGQLNTGTFQYIDRIENRRVFAADPQTGLVIGLSHFRHPMDNLPYSVTNLDGTTSEMTAANLSFAPFDLPAAHIFKIGADGQVHEIEAMGFTAPYNSPTGWE